MHKIKIVLLFVLLSVAVLITGCSHLFNSRASSSPILGRIVEKGELVVGMTGNMPPLNMTTKAGKVIGLEPDLSRDIATAMGVKLSIRTMPFSELLAALQTGKVDMIMSGMTITPKRNLDVAFVGPYFLSGKCILSKQEALSAADGAGVLNHSSLKLAALKGSTSQQFVEELAPEAELTPIVDYDEGVDMVLNDRADALVGDYPICIVSLLRYPDRGLVSVISLLTQEPLGVALPANDPLFVNWMENFLSNLESNGILTDLKEHWFENGPWLKELK